MEKKLKQALDKRGLRYNFVAKHVGVTDGYFNNLIKPPLISSHVIVQEKYLFL